MDNFEAVNLYNVEISLIALIFIFIWYNQNFGPKREIISDHNVL